MARMSHKFLRKMARSEPSYLNEDVEENVNQAATKRQAEEKRGPERQLSPLTSIASSDEEGESRDDAPMSEAQPESTVDENDDRNGPLLQPTISAGRIRLLPSKGKEREQATHKPRRNVAPRTPNSAVGSAPSRQSSRTIYEASKPPQSKSRLPTGPVMCHQCRSTNKWSKMTCSSDPETSGRCKRKYCANCIVKRYPDITFDASSKTFICPVCTGNCNCTVCSRKRGEEYVSTRFNKVDEDILKKIEAGEPVRNRTSASISTKLRPAKRIKRSNSKSRSSTSNKKSAVDPLKKTASIIENYGGVRGGYWGAVFSVHGERIGTGFHGENISEIIVAPESTGMSETLPDALTIARKRKRTEEIYRPHLHQSRRQTSYSSSSAEEVDHDEVERLVSQAGHGKNMSEDEKGVNGKLYIGDETSLFPISASN